MEKKIKARTKKRLVYIGLFFIASIVLDFFIEMHAPDKNKIGTETLVML
ncbi:MAG: hypothetical protein RR659_03325 [Bacilli bacterium]